METETDIILNNMRKSRDAFQEVMDLLSQAYEKAKDCKADMIATEINKVFLCGLDVSARIQDRINEAMAS